MTFQFRPAIRSQTPIMLGIAGPSRAGKTYSALRVATGLANGAPIAMVDTESGRGLQYAEKFKFLYTELGAPFTSERYLEAIEAAKAAGARVIIVDSASHEHEGPGGMLERHEEELNRLTKDPAARDKYNFTAWIVPKAAHTKYVNRLLQLGPDTHFIFCFRAKNELKILPGKPPIDLGLQPICSSRFEYEMTSLLMLPEGSKGTVDLKLQASGLREPFDQFIRDGVQLDEALGRRLAEWASGTKSPEPAKETAESLPVSGVRPSSGNGPTVSIEQINKLHGLLEAADLKESDLCAVVTDKTGVKVDRVAEIPSSVYGQCVKWVKTQAGV